MDTGYIVQPIFGTNIEFLIMLYMVRKQLLQVFKFLPKNGVWYFYTDVYDRVAMVIVEDDGIKLYHRSQWDKISQGYGEKFIKATSLSVVHTFQIYLPHLRILYTI